MIAYVDSSVLLRFVLDQPDRLSDLLALRRQVTSLLTELECLRAVESGSLARQLDGDEARGPPPHRLAQLRRMRRLSGLALVLQRAGESYPLPVKSLDAIHLASALIVREREARDLVFATHDRQLGRLAAAMDFPVIGLCSRPP